MEKEKKEGACVQKGSANWVACTIAAADPCNSCKVVALCVGSFKWACLTSNEVQLHQVSCKLKQINMEVALGVGGGFEVCLPLHGELEMPKG
eukprot:4849269-Ditylum_brightwellii.AAC.1